MYELADGYRHASRLMTEHIKMLENTGKNLALANVLRAHRRELNKLAELCEHYYERGYWRDEAYTFNKSNNRRIRAVVQRVPKYKRRDDGETQKKSKYGHTKRVDSETARDAVDVLICRLFTGKSG